MAFCLTTYNVLPLDYEGIIGLGKWDANVTEFSYIMQMYVENRMNPSVIIDLNFEGQVNNIGTPNLEESNGDIGTIIGNTTSYSKSSEWALEVTAWTWDSKTYTPSEEGLNDIAVLQSTTPYIAVP